LAPGLVQSNKDGRERRIREHDGARTVDRRHRRSRARAGTRPGRFRQPAGRLQAAGEFADVVLVVFTPLR